MNSAEDKLLTAIGITRRASPTRHARAVGLLKAYRDASVDVLRRYSIQARVLLYLVPRQGERRSYAQIASATGDLPTTVRYTLQRLISEGVLTRTDYGQSCREARYGYTFIE